MKDRCGAARQFKTKFCDRSDSHIFLEVQLKREWVKKGEILAMSAFN